MANSYTKGSLGRDPWEFPARTQGPLGRNDAGDPDSADWFVGDTPGALGRNDHGDPTGQRQTSPDVKSEPIQLAWNIEPFGKGHGTISDASVVLFKSSGKLPGRTTPSPETERRIALILDSVRMWVIGKDYNIGLHYWDFGQKHHFMAIKGESKMKAYEAGVKHIFDETEKAIKQCKSTIYYRYFFDPGPPALPLGYALHALQDSFSPGHTKRGEGLIIQDIYVYEDQDKKQHGQHDDLSALYEKQKKGASISEVIDSGKKSPNSDVRKKSELLEAAIAASGLLLNYFKLRVLDEDVHAAQAKQQLRDKYLLWGMG